MKNQTQTYGSKRRRAGFTIVELLIVIVVIGILAAITIVAYNGVQQRARVSRANSELETLAKAIMVARINQDKVLGQITGSYCTACSPPAVYNSTLDNISAASGANLSSLKAGDPWGNHYAIDENELEGGSCANRDIIGLSVAQPGVVAPIIPFYTCPN